MLNKTCSACSKDRKKNKLVYDNQFRAYCSRPHECSESNPNSTTNIIKNGKMTHLLAHDDAVKLFSEQANGDTIRLLDSPVTIRLNDIKQAQFIDETCKRLNVTTSEFIRLLIENALNSKEYDTPTPIETTTPENTNDDDNDEMTF
jgi:hypothetical protein